MTAMTFHDFHAIFFDLDGTLYHDTYALPGAVEALAHLRSSGQRYAAITNTSARTEKQLSAMLSAMGIRVPADHIYTSGRAAVTWVLERWPRPRVCNFGGMAMRGLLGDRAVMVRSVNEPCDVVLVGTHTRVENRPFDMDLALLGLEHLRRGAHLVAGCADRVFPIHGGSVEFGSGALAAMFIYGANLPPERIHYAGKPEPDFFLQLCRRLAVDPHRCLLVGDNLESDIHGGLSVGMTTALLLSGVTRREHLAASAVQPHAVFRDLTDMLARMTQ